MLVTAVLTSAVVWCLLFAVIPPLPLGLLCVTLSGALAILGRHSHGGAMVIDMLAQRSHLSCVNAGLKTWGSLILLLICVSSESVIVGIVVAIMMLFMTVAVGKLSLHDYLSLLALPAAFLLVSGLALLFSYVNSPIGVLNIPCFSGWISVTATAQEKTALVMAKALGALSCLYLLSLSTPMTEIIAVLRRAHVPAIIVELMYLIYRYIFILLDMHRTMHDAAESRLGYDGYSRSLRTTGNIYANLLARSFKKANACFDAMESRCYDGEIRFLERKKPITSTHAIIAFAILLCAISLLFFGRSL